MKIHTTSSKETERIGFLISKEEKTNLFTLKGNLGSGKTTLLKGFARGLKIKEQITSPTFVIFKKYKKEKGFFYHFDAYRINEKDLSVLNFKQILNEKDSVVGIEWSENIEKALPKNKIEIKLRFLSDKKRELIIKGISDKIKDQLRARSSAG